MAAPKPSDGGGSASGRVYCRHVSKPNGRESIRLAVTDFGPIARAEVDLRPLTVFIGPSNTGKSYLAILIYALHSLFSIDRFRRSGLRNIRRWQDAIPTDESVKRLVEWMNERESESPRRRPSFDGPAPEAIASMIRPILENDSGGTILRDEIGRCFGIGRNTRRLIRRNRSNANVVLQRGPFRFDLAITGRNHRFSATIPDHLPLSMAPNTKIPDLAYLRALSQTMELDERRFIAMELIDDLVESVVPQVVGELCHPAFYLPADRAGVMHAHRVVVSALVERSASAGLRNAPQVPTLSGVLADFLEQLINIDDREGEASRHGTDFAKEIERDILRGAIRIDLSETRYPSFFYRPAGWKEDLPLMSTSSMVTELAPVVLYLRHLLGRGDTLIIEEPESHLHPEMQAALACRLAGLARSGVHVIVTTHSEWLLDQFANLVRMSELNESQRDGLPGNDVTLRPDQFGAWLFKRKQRPNGSIVEEIPVDPDAGGLLSDYSRAADQLYGTWSEIGNRIAERSAQT